MSPIPRRTPLFERHLAAGAKLVEFAGWEMPVFYKGPPAPTGPPAPVREEHMAVRESCGVFDVSHMGQIETSGPGALALLQRLLSNDVAAIPIAGSQYSVLCREDGGVLDDLFTYRLADERFLTVTNAANHERDLDGSARTPPPARTFKSRTASTATRCSRSRARAPARSRTRLPTRRCRRE